MKLDARVTLFVTLVGVFFTPLFYWLVMTYLARGRRDAVPGATASTPELAQGASS